MKLIDIHNTLSKNKRLSSNYKNSNHAKMARFLPCIVFHSIDKKTGDVYYIMSYRVWRRADNLPLKNLTFPGTKGHPWYDGWGYSMFDGTAFMLLKISKDAQHVKIIKDNISEQGNGKIDMRLLHIGGNKYHATYNTFGRINPIKRPNDFNQMKNPKCFYYSKNGVVQYNPSRKQLSKDLTNQKMINDYLDWSGCTFQNKALVTINDKTLEPTINEVALVCPQHHGRVEKNHAMFYDKRNRICYQYAIVPWSFFDPNCKLEVPMKTTLFKRLADYYDPQHSYFSKHVQFSCSTPLIPYNDKEHLALGHFKIKYEHISKLPKDSPAYKFTNQLKNLLKISKYNGEKYYTKIHYELIYGMFVYTVDRNSWKLRRASPCFVLASKENPNALCFPSGIVQHSSNDTFFVSYHENDLQIKLWHLDRTEIESLLKYNNRTPVTQYPFEIFKY